MAEPQETGPTADSQIPEAPDLSDWDLTSAQGPQGPSFKQKAGEFWQRGREKVANINQRSAEFFNSIQIREGISHAYERVAGRVPTPEQVSGIGGSARDRLANVRVLGQPLLDIVVGSVAGAGAKEVAKFGFAIAGVGGLPVAAGVGAVAGGAGAVVREYLKQRGEGISIEEDSAVGIRAKLKNEFRRIQAADKTRLRNAAIRGVIFGAVGGVVGGVIADKLSEELAKVQWPSIQTPQINLPQLPKVELPEVKLPEVSLPELPQVNIPEIKVPWVGAPQPEAAPPGPELPERAEVPFGEVAPSPLKEPVSTPEATTPQAPPPEEAIPQVPEAPPPLPPATALEAPTPVVPAEAVSPPAEPTPMQQPAEALTTPTTETLTIPQGSNPWQEVNSYLTEQLGRAPANQEIREAVTRLITENNITDATKIPVDAQFNINGVNEYIGQILSEQPPISADLAALPENIPLPNGSNPWNEVSKYLESTLDRPPTNAEILDVTKEVCRQSGIRIPSWGIPGPDLHTQLPPGKILVFNEFVKERIAAKMAA